MKCIGLCLLFVLQTLSACAESSLPYWIWPQEVGKDGEEAWFRKTFEATGTERAELFATCDNELQIYLNGKLAGTSTSWSKGVRLDVSKLLLPGKNLIAVLGRNKGNGSAGLLVHLELKQGDKKSTHVSNATWKVASTAHEGWNTDASLDDTQWKAPYLVARLGEGSWASKVNASILEAKPQPTATPPSAIKIKEGFKVELLYSVPLGEQGSWVVSCFDDKGRMIVGDQYGKLYRVTPPALNGDPGETKIEPLPVELGEAQGLSYAFGALYAVTNSSKYPRGLYRITDSNQDDVPDKVEALRLFPNEGGEHGPHAVMPGPDGKSLYVVVGNQTPLTEMDASRVPRHWGEDNLLPPLMGRGFMAEVMAPGGWIAKTDKDGRYWELIGSGYRNTYDAAFNKAGHLFTFDADMEWDFGVPWYRPTRISEVVSGAESGWRSLSKKWPSHWEDSTPPVVDIGPGSPTGVVFGYGAKFPAKYQNALFAADWSYGKLYAVHLQPDGAGYKGDFEEFMSASPLPLTDLNVSPRDGALYFLVGGRRVQSGLYRVTYTGNQNEVTSSPASVASAATESLRLREELERFHTAPQEGAVDFVWPHLGSADRYLRFAARIALEHQPVGEWQQRVLDETKPRVALTALMALTRSSADKSLLPRILDSLERLPWNELDDSAREALIRNYSLAFCRFGLPDETTRARVLKRLSPLLPTGERRADIDLCEVLAFLQDDAFLPKAIHLLETAPTQEDQISYAKNLRFLKAGWTPELRERYFKWVCLRAPLLKGGASMPNFMEDIKRDAMAQLSEDDTTALKAILETVPDKNAPQYQFTPREFVKNWTIEDMDPLLAVGLEGGRNFENGRNLFGVTTCFVCHRLAGEGGAVGPDLSSVAGKYSPRDLLIHILEPSKEISDQYGQKEVSLKDGSKVYGRIINLAGDRITFNTNMMDMSATQRVQRRDIQQMEESKVSMMPPGLLSTCTDTDILDLLAYLLSNGDKSDPVFKK